MGFLYLFGSIFCSIAIAQLLKLSETKKLLLLRVLVVNYFVAFVVAFTKSGAYLPGAQFSIQLPVVILALVLGVFFIANFFIYSKSIDLNGMGVSITAMRMSLAIPVLISLLIYNEYVSNWAYAGIGIAVLSIVLLIPRQPDTAVKSKIVIYLPVLLFLFTGLAEGGLKVFEREFIQRLDESLFLAFIFCTAFFIGLAILFLKKELRFTLKEIILGLFLGIFNLYSSYFLILALKSFPGSVVFPLVNISIIVLGTLIGLFFWKDKITKTQWVGLLTATLSIFMLL